MSTPQKYHGQPSGDESPIETILEWAEKTAKLKEAKEAKKIYHNLISQDVSSSISVNTEDDQRQILHKTFTVYKNCKLYQIIQKAKSAKFNISTSGLAEVEYQELKAAEKCLLESTRVCIKIKYYGVMKGP